LKTDYAKLERAFSPQCVVVVGDSAQSGFQWLNGQKDFNGKLYSVQVNPESIKSIEALGVENYTSLLDIPEPVDLVIVATPRKLSLQVLEDCIRKDVAAAHFFTAGFSETDTEEGIELERLLVERAKQANFHLIGPNCMGVFNPSVGIRQNPFQYRGYTGPVGLISQSGTHCLTFALEAHREGVDVNKSVSFGNGVVLDSTNYLEYFGQDPEITVIGMYLEGIRDGRRFFEVLREVTKHKPVLIWKGGRTEEGWRAVASHTGSLALPQAVWESAVRQCGAINVAGMQELIDTMKALIHLPPVYGKRVAITGGSGGQSVAIADVFAEAGLSVPPLAQESYDELATFFSLIGGGYRNPIDTGNANRVEMKRIMNILERDTNTDNLVLLVGVGFGMPDSLDSEVKLLSGIRKRTPKPVVVVAPYSAPEEMRRVREVGKKYQAKGIPVFPSIERGAIALRNAFTYYRQRNGSDT